MNVKPLISFVIPTYNRVAWLPLAIESLLGQTEQNIEVVVVDDGSTDGTQEFLQHYKDNPRVKVIRNKLNLGAGPSRNLGAKAAQADIIGVADSDDVYINTHAETILRWFKEHPSSELVNFPYVSINYFEDILEGFHGEPFDLDGYLKDGGVNYFCNPSAAYRKVSALITGGYPKETDTKTDDMGFVEAWIKAGKKIDFCGVENGDEVPFAVMHRILPNSMMSNLRGFEPGWLKKKEPANV